MPARKAEIWFVTGSQHLYGEDTLAQVAAHSDTIAAGLAADDAIPVPVVCKPTLTTPEAITALAREANASQECIGLVLWMHTFSPAKMWIAGLQILAKPLLHFHTQFGRDIPWSTIDMDFMNLNQSAHGGREFGFMCARMRLSRKVVTGHWEDPEARAEIATWSRAALAWSDAQGAKFARFGDNMRDVAVTEGNKVSAQMQMGYSVYGYGVGDLVTVCASISDAEIDSLCSEIESLYIIPDELKAGGDRCGSLKDAARIELGLKTFLDEGGFKGFTTTFEDLHGLKQLPGIAAQRLMAQGYGFAAEGDWKTAALVRAMKVMAGGLDGGTSFMEDYTYHFHPDGMKVLGAHMLEICPSIAASTPTAQVHPLGIGGKEDPVRLVFDTPRGAGINASLIDLGNRFRFVVNEVDVVPPEEPLPRLPVARALWIPRPDLKTAASSWILAGGAHHTGFSQALKAQHLEDFAEIAGIEHVLIGAETKISSLKKELRANEAYYHLEQGIR